MTQPGNGQESAFFDDGDDSNNRDVVLFHGNDSNIANPFDADGWDVTLPGINYDTGAARMELHVSDGQTFIVVFHCS